MLTKVMALELGPHQVGPSSLQLCSLLGLREHSESIHLKLDFKAAGNGMVSPPP